MDVSRTLEILKWAAETGNPVEWGGRTIYIAGDPTKYATCNFCPEYIHPNGNGTVTWYYGNV